MRSFTCEQAAGGQLRLVAVTVVVVVAVNLVEVGGGCGGSLAALCYTPLTC